MTKEYIYSGKTEELAIEKGLAELALDRDEVSVEIIELPTKGFLGIGAKDAKVKIIVTLPDPKPAKRERTHEKKQDRRPAKDAQPREKKPAPEKKAEEEVLVTPHQMPGEHIAPKKRSTTAPAKAKAEPRDAKREQKPRKPEKPVPQEQLEKGAEVCRQFLKETLAVLEIECEINVSTDNNMLTVSLVGDGMGLIIGRRGETLDALQQLAALVVNKDKGAYIKVMIDTENYRAKREDALQSVAARTAAKALKYKKNITLEPMNPYERRIIHSALQGYDHITTKSVGSEPNRRVVVCYVK